MSAGYYYTSLSLSIRYLYANKGPDRLATIARLLSTSIFLAQIRSVWGGGFWLYRVTTTWLMAAMQRKAGTAIPAYKSICACDMSIILLVSYNYNMLCLSRVVSQLSYLSHVYQHFYLNTATITVSVFSNSNLGPALTVFNMRDERKKLFIILIKII